MDCEVAINKKSVLFYLSGQGLSKEYVQQIRRALSYYEVHVRGAAMESLKKTIWHSDIGDMVRNIDRKRALDFESRSYTKSMTMHQMERFYKICQKYNRVGKQAYTTFLVGSYLGLRALAILCLQWSHVIFPLDSDGNPLIGKDGLPPYLVIYIALQKNKFKPEYLKIYRTDRPETDPVLQLCILNSLWGDAKYAFSKPVDSGKFNSGFDEHSHLQYGQFETFLQTHITHETMPQWGGKVKARTHLMRNTSVYIAVMRGATPQQIREGLRWRPDSQSLNTYIYSVREDHTKMMNDAPWQNSWEELSNWNLEPPKFGKTLPTWLQDWKPEHTVDWSSCVCKRHRQLEHLRKVGPTGVSTGDPDEQWEHYHLDLDD